MKNKLSILLYAVAFAAAFLSAPAHAVDTASFVFDTVSDPGDLADGPDFDVQGSGMIDDGSGCDAVVMVMVDPTGTPTDVDTFCLSLVTGQGGSDGDYGSSAGYMPVASPVTYALFDLTAADIAALSGLGDSDPAYFNYVVANARLLAENTFAVAGVPTAAAFTFRAVTIPVPTLGSAGLGLLVVLMMGTLAWQVRRRRTER